MLKGHKEFNLKLEKAKALFQKQAEKEIAKALFDIHGDTVRKLNTGKRSGNTYRKGTAREHQASAQGEYPKSDTGQLASSLFFELEKDGSKRSGKFGSKASHAKHLEYKPAAEGGRPWLKPQFDIYAKKLREKLLQLNKNILEKL
jgi:hypothetical protein